MGAAGRRPKPSISRGGTAQSSASTWSIGNVMTSRAVRQCASKDWSASHPHDGYAGAAAHACRLWTGDRAPRGDVAPFRSMDILAVAPALQQRVGHRLFRHRRRSRRHDAGIALERYPRRRKGSQLSPWEQDLEGVNARISGVVRSRILKEVRKTVGVVARNTRPMRRLRSPRPPRLSRSLSCRRR